MTIAPSSAAAAATAAGTTLRDLQACLRALRSHEAEEQNAAYSHLRAVGSADADGLRAVLALATATPEPWVAGHVLGAVAECRHVDEDASGFVLLAFALLDRGDPQLTILTTRLLANHLHAPIDPETAQVVIARALREWPSDPRTLVWPLPLPPCLDRGSVLVALAAATGDRAVLERLLQPPDASPPDTNAIRHAWFVRKCLALAAPRVDVAFARQLHGWFGPALDWNPRAPRDSAAAWVDAAHDVLVGIFPLLPQDLVPSYEGVLADPVWFERLLATRSRGLPEAQVRLLEHVARAW